MKPQIKEKNAYKIVKEFIKDIFRFIRRPLPAVLSATLVVLILIVTGVFKSDPLSAYEIVPITREDVRQEVAITGRVVAQERVELALERGGVVSFVGPGVGDQAAAGTVLVAVRAGTLAAQRDEAAAAVRAAKLELRAIEQAPAASRVGFELEQARMAFVNNIAQSQLELDNILGVSVDPLFRNPRTSPEFGANIADGALSVWITGTPDENIQINAVRRELNRLINNWRYTDTQPLEEHFAANEKTLTTAQDLLVRIGDIVNTITPGGATERTIVETARANISSARTNVASTLASLRSAWQNYRSAESNTSLFARERAQIALEQAEARLAATDAQLAETVIRSPINGTVILNDARVGEAVPAGTPIVALISDSEFKIEALVPEADIAKLAVGDTARVTLDAYGDRERFEAAITFIDPAETIIESIAAYKVTLQFKGREELVRSGMTANIDVEAGIRENVLAVPQRAIIVRDGNTFVRLAENGATREVPIVAGLRGSEGMVEVLSGLSEDSRIVLSGPDKD